MSTPGTFPTGRGPAHQQPTRDNPACPIADIFVPLGDIGGQGRGQGRVGGGASGRRATWEVGGGGAGKAGSEGRSGEIGGVDATSDAGTEEEEGGHVLLTALPWGMQESGARALRGDARAGGSDSGKGTSGTADEEGTRGCHGGKKEQGWGKEVARDGKEQNPGEWGDTLGAARPLEWTPIPTEWSVRRGAARPNRLLT